jgi:CP family cyanate transporter-like MFS transporter
MLVRLALIWLVGGDLRLVMLAVPPVLPAVHRDLGLDEKSVAALNSLPLLVLAAAAVPGSLLISRLGARRALLTGLLAIALAGAARGVGPLPPMLFSMTLLMGAGVAVSQPASPSVIKDWFPAQVGLATAVYANGMLVGEILPVSLSEAVLHAVGGSWELSLAFWSLPVLLTAAALALLTPHRARPEDEPPARWWPDWGRWQTWQAGLLLGCMSLLYWGANGFLPDLLHSSNRAGLVTPALAVLNAAQLPVSVLITLRPSLFIRRRWPFLLSGAAMVAGVPGMLLAPGASVLLWTGLLGAVSGLVFVCALALPPLLSAPEDVARMSAAMFTITYTCSFVGPFLGGAAWDATGIPFTAFAPAFLAGLVMLALGARLRLRPSSEAAAGGG